MATFVEAERIRRLQEENKRAVEKAIKRLCRKDFERLRMRGGKHDSRKGKK